ncbi:MAG: HisA/HisF-related TIM barrel protein [Gemmatimonadales bacterium]
MIAIPALDLRDGACVQLVGGDYAAERIRIDDPVSVARRWADLGFRRLHIVDLDAATGRGSNRETVRDILGASPLPMQVGGGVRFEEDVAALLAAGADRVVVGTRAIEDRDWLATIATEHPGRVIVAADVRERRVVTRGWSETLALDVFDLVAELSELPLAGLLVTAVHREGRMAGADVPLMRALVARTSLPVIASGGIATLEDLQALAAAGCTGAVLGMALYTGTLDPRLVAEEFTT